MDPRELADKLSQMASDISILRVEVGRLAAKDDALAKSIERLEMLETKVTSLDKASAENTARHALCSRDGVRIDKLEADLSSMLHRMSMIMGGVAVVTVLIQVLSWFVGRF